MPTLLKDLRIGEVSSVDRGAGRGVKVVLMKRRDGGAGYAVNVGLGNAALAAVFRAHAPTVTKIAKDAAAATTFAIDEYLKREFTAEQRQAAEAKGHAMPGGGYPINDVADLHNAIRAFGRAKDKAATKKHIIARARALGALDAIPESWKVAKRGASPLARFLGRVGFRKDFDEEIAEEEATERAEGMLDEFEEALCALHEAVCEILCDEEIADKPAALQESFDQFKEHVQGVVPEGIEDAMNAAALIADGYGIDGGGSISKGDEAMTPEEKKDHEETKKNLAKAMREIAVLKMSDKHKAFMDHPDAKMPEGGKDKFAEMTAEERDAHMAKHPMEKRDDPIAKALAPLQAENEALRKRMEASELKDAIASFAKRAADLGAPAEFGETIRKAYGGDAASLDAILKKLGEALKAQAAQESSSVIFAEFGKAGAVEGGATGNAHEQLMAKAREYLEKNRSEKGLTVEKAYARVYQDPANQALVQLHKRQSSAQRREAS